MNKDQNQNEFESIELMGGTWTTDSRGQLRVGLGIDMELLAGNVYTIAIDWQPSESFDVAVKSSLPLTT